MTNRDSLLLHDMADTLVDREKDGERTGQRRAERVYAPVLIANKHSLLFLMQATTEISAIQAFVAHLITSSGQLNMKPSVHGSTLIFYC